jgi:hypothetical protein
MIAPLKEPSTRKDRRRPSAGLVRAHRWISQTLLVDSPASNERESHNTRAWLAAIWIVIVASFYFGRLIAEWVGSQ